jgi:hypothetical protein
MGKLYLLNSPIMTGPALYLYTIIDQDRARAIIKEAIDWNEEIISAIGHQSTAILLSEILEYEVPVNRINVSLTTQDRAIVIRLLERLPEGQVLGIEELKKVKYELGSIYVWPAYVAAYLP